MKNNLKYLWIPIAAFGAVIPALVALNLFAVSFPSWIMLIAAAALAAACVLYVLMSGAKRWAKIALPVVSGLMILAGLFTAYCLPYWNSMSMRSDWDYSCDYDSVLTLEQAEEDMAGMRANVNRCHPAFIDGEPEIFTDAYDASLQRLAQDSEITVNDLRREIQRTLSVLGDGHTNAYPSYDGRRYLKTIAGRKAEGFSLSTVNGMTAEELFEERRDLFSYEVDSWGIGTLSDNLSSLDGLDFLGIDPEGAEFTWKNQAGETVTDTLTAADFLTMEEYLKYNSQYAGSDSQQPQSFVSYKIDTDNDIAILTLTECRYDSEYKACLRKMFAEVKAKGITNVAVDLRGNGGGNSLVANEFIRYLPVRKYKVDSCYHRLGCFMFDLTGQSTRNNRRYPLLTFDGDVFLLTDSDSFSSAMLFAVYIKDNDLGTIIGEPPGNTPNSYGDVANFRLDNSGLYMSVSTKQFFRPDRECTDRLVMPDAECESGEAMELLYILAQ